MPSIWSDEVASALYGYADSSRIARRVFSDASPAQVRGIGVHVRRSRLDVLFTRRE